MESANDRDKVVIDVEEAISALGLKEQGNEIVSYEQLSGGLTNDNIAVYLKKPCCQEHTKVKIINDRLVLRRFKKSTSIHLGYDRYREYINAKIAADHGISPPVIGFIQADDNEEGHGGALALCYIDGTTSGDDDVGDLCTSDFKASLLANTLRALHGMKHFDNIFDPFKARKWYENQVKSITGKSIEWEDYETLITLSSSLEIHLNALEEPLVPCHNDLLAANFIKQSTKDHDRLALIDFELSGMAPASWESGNIVSENGLDGDEEAIERLTMHYWLGGKVVQSRPEWLESRVNRVKAWSIVSKITWSAWGAVLYHLNQHNEQPFDYKEWSLERVKKAKAALQDEHMLKNLLAGLKRDELDLSQ
ncbi:kinase-like protein [Meira miltonrushii]|uniref:ethanolamine kinase n=1 Tax=Meira miltonrushii TaxID=1280837 RepID=A0A316V340_9BASI|nr:kinase-like protein [Meira miltonrushii]PWN31674.1 kinase-like protein [Meira miltonrushii]